MHYIIHNLHGIKKTRKDMLLYENNDFVFLFHQQQFAKANKF